MDFVGAKAADANRSFWRETVLPLASRKAQFPRVFAFPARNLG
jgi:hypothetical protein